MQTSIYIHIPFCVHRCHYCDFNIATGQAHLMHAYTDALVREIELAQPQPPATSIRTIFFGGGTPSLLPPAEIGRIMQAVRSRWPLTTDAEVSLEANPDGLTYENLVALRELGINRLSLGVQSFDNTLLRRIGRDHDAANAEVAFYTARAAGFANLSLDLIYGLPEQSEASWRATLERALTLEPEHISLYGLMIEAGTAFSRLHTAGRLPLPEEELTAEMYILAETLLSRADFRHYEISNWARQGYECRHNMTYWRAEPYLAFGCGAHAYWGGRRYHNVNPMREYITLVEQGNLAALVRDVEEIDLMTALEEAIMLALRLDTGLEPELFAARFGIDLETAFASELQELRAWGLIEQPDSKRSWVLTQCGRLLANQVCARLIERVQSLEFGVDSSNKNTELSIPQLQTH